MRKLYRDETNTGTVMEFNDEKQRKVIILDAQYRTTKQFGTYGTQTTHKNYS